MSTNLHPDGSLFSRALTKVLKHVCNIISLIYLFMVNITGVQSSFLRIRYYVKPTSLRMNKQYIIYYQTWTWVFSTGKWREPTHLLTH